MTPLRRLALPTALTLVMLAVLVGLGTWQVERRAWKHALLDAIAAAEARPGIPLPARPNQFLKVRVSGILRTDLPALYGAEGRDRPQGPVLGAQLLMPLDRPGADTVLVLLGWVPALPAPQPPHPATIEGYVRLAEHPAWFSPADDAAGHRFYTLDPAAIGAALGLARVAPFTVVALGPETGAIPEPAHTMPRPVDNHLSYALTWFGLAATLFVIFILYARKVLRP